MTDGERLQKFNADFARLRHNREKVPLEQLRTRYAKAYNDLMAEVRAGADWFADTYIKALAFPRQPEDRAGNEWLDKKIAAILEEERRPGGRMEQYRAALANNLDRPAFEHLVWEIYDRLEREAFMPYWNRHCRRVGEPGNQWVYNDITKKWWYSPERQGSEDTCGFWACSDRTGRDSRFPPDMKEDAQHEQTGID